MKKSQRRSLRFNQCGMFHFHPYRLELVHRGFNCKLEEQPARVLAHMMARDGDEVSRAELVHLLWPSETYGDFSHRLDNVMSKLRAALYDNPADPSFIKTLRGQGFCFIGAERIRCIGEFAATDAYKRFT